MGILPEIRPIGARGSRTINDHCPQLLKKDWQSNRRRRWQRLLRNFMKVTASTSRLSEQLVTKILRLPVKVEGLACFLRAKMRRTQSVYMFPLLPR
jgi:hypothetical protein